MRFPDLRGQLVAALAPLAGEGWIVRVDPLIQNRRLGPPGRHCAVVAPPAAGRIVCVELVGTTTGNVTGTVPGQLWEAAFGLEQAPEAVATIANPFHALHGVTTKVRGQAQSVGRERRVQLGSALVGLIAHADAVRLEVEDHRREDPQMVPLSALAETVRGHACDLDGYPKPAASEDLQAVVRSLRAPAPKHVGDAHFETLELHGYRVNEIFAIDGDRLLVGADRQGHRYAVALVPLDDDSESMRGVLHDLRARIQRRDVVEEPFPVEGSLAAPFPIPRGPSLAQALRNGPYDATAALRLGTELARELGVWHGAGIVHQDVRPEHVFAGERPEELRITGLDFARVDPVGGRTGDLLAVRGDEDVFLAPEIRARRPARSRREADVYGWSCVVSYAILGALDGADRDAGRLQAAGVPELWVDALTSARAPEPGERLSGALDLPSLVARLGATP